MIELSPDEVRALRTHAQHLDKRFPQTDLLNAVQTVCGIQAQLPPAMMLALRARVSDLSVSDVEGAIGDSRTLVQTWAMRGTLHLVASSDVHWLIGLLGSVFAAKDNRRRLQLGLDENLSKAGLSGIQDILSEENHPLTRHELLKKLIARGIAIPEKGQALIHLIALAALEGIICLGPYRPNGKATYALLDGWVGNEKTDSGSDAAVKLVQRYLQGYAPADVKDFAAWSGLPLVNCKKAWKQLEETGELVEVKVKKRTLGMLKQQQAFMNQSKSNEPVVRLLPAFDTYALGYADRDDLVLPEHRHEVYHGGQTVPIVLVDGLAAGVWRYDRQGKRLNITLRAFDGFSKQVEHGIAEEADDIGRFWDTPVSVTSSFER